MVSAAMVTASVTMVGTASTALCAQEASRSSIQHPPLCRRISLDAPSRTCHLSQMQQLRPQPPQTGAGGQKTCHTPPFTSTSFPSSSTSSCGLPKAKMKTVHCALTPAETPPVSLRCQPAHATHVLADAPATCPCISRTAMAVPCHHESDARLKTRGAPSQTGSNTHLEWRWLPMSDYCTRHTAW